MTEGTTTEVQYVERLNQHLRSDAIAVSVKSVGVGKAPVAVVRKAIELRNNATKNDKKFDHVVCLVDVDQHSSLDDAVATALREGIHLLVSRLKFEVWLLWHVSDSRAAVGTRQLDNLMTKHALFSQAKHLAPKFPFNKVDSAVRTAQAADPELRSCRIGPDPSSAMPILVQMLRGKEPPAL